MPRNGARLTLVVAALPLGALSELVTVSRYRSACSAVDTTASGTGTGVRIKTTLSPTPFTDAAVNGGAAFTIEIQPMGQSALRRQAESRTYLNAAGYATTDPAEAVQYRINQGQLFATTGGSVTANESDTSVLLAISTTLGCIRTQFASRNLALHWNNPAFEGGAAEFFMVPVGDGAQRVVAFLNGAHAANWIPVTFAIQAASRSGIIVPSGLSATSSSAASASIRPSSNVSPEGLCGTGTDFDCYGASDGPCCSQYGYCGGNTNRADYCGSGCQVAFGNCDPPSAVSSSAGLVPTPSGASSIWFSTAVTFGVGPAASGSVTVSSASSKIAASSSRPVFPGLSSGSIAISTAVFPTLVLSTSSGMTYTSTRSPASATASNLPTISDGGTPIGPVGPGVRSSSAPAYTSASDSRSSSSRAASSIRSEVSSVAPSQALNSSASSARSSITASSSAASPVDSGCQASDGSTRTDSNRIQYTIGCGKDTTGRSVGSSFATRASFEECFTVCDTTAHCQGFTWSGANGAQYGIGAGNCSFKGIAVDGNPVVFSGSGGNPSMVAAIKVVQIEKSETTSSSAAISSTASSRSSVTVASSTVPLSSSTWSTSTPPVSSSTSYFIPDFAPTPSSSSSSPVLIRQSSSSGSPAVASSSSTTFLLSSSSSITLTSDSPSTPHTTSSSSSSIAPTSSSPPSPFTTSSSSSSSSIAPTSSSPSIPLTTSSASTSTVASSRVSSLGSSSYLVLPSPTACDWGDPADWPEDDSYCRIDTPQAIVVYGNSDTATFAASNGYISLGQGSQAYEAERLPSTNIPPATIIPFWDDLAVFGGQTPAHGVFYQFFDDGVSWEYYLSRSQSPAELYHFTVEYQYATPGVFVYRYFHVGPGDNGQFASVGIQGNQGSAAGALVGFQYSYETQRITPGLVVTCDTAANMCTSNAAAG